MSRISMSLLITTILVFSLAVYPGAAKQDYKQTNLVSDISGLAKFTDPNLVNPWGLARSSTSPWWVADNGMGVSTLYNGSGNPLSLVVTIPPSGSSPTGVVFNGGTGFEVDPGKPARFIFVSEDGRITGWNPSVNPTNAVIKVDNSAGNAVYKGVAIANNGGKDYLYVANFRNGTVDVFDTTFKEVSLGDNFKDEKIPEGFAPFNVVNINGDLFVTFAKQDDQKHDDVAGPKLGFVDKFNPDGKLLMRLNHGPWMNSPWGVVLAPDNFGKLSNKLLVGNFGSGHIGIFDPENGNFNGFVEDNEGMVTIDGLWALVFGNNANAGPSNVLFFTAGIDKEQHGLFGTISQDDS
ncbi:MAG TPA: TIGR03118 family protein [Candidatus Methanoperedens sp.]